MSLLLFALKNLTSQEPFALSHKVHLSDVLLRLVDEGIFLSGPELSGLQAETDIIKEVRVHSLTIVEEITERSIVSEDILIQVVLHQFSLDVSWQRVKVVLLL